MSSSALADAAVNDRLAAYREERSDHFGDPEFATWFEREYVPIAGGWQY